MIELKFLGRGSAFNLKEGSNSAYFEYKNQLIVIDSGETTLASLDKKVDFKRYENIYYLITHLHNDHIGSLGSTISYLFLKKDIVINVVHPLKTITTLLDLMGIDRKFYRFIQVDDLEISSLKIQFIETEHTDLMTCYGIYFELENNRIYYSGDANDIPQVIFNKLVTGKLDRLYQDVTIFEESKDSHMYYKTLVEKVPKEKLEKIYCMHLEDNADNILKENSLTVVSF